MQTGYSVDVARGLDHPDSVQARRARIASAKVKETNRQTDIRRACLAIRENCRTEQDVIDVLHALSGGIMSPSLRSSEIDEISQELDVMADSIEYREEA